MVSGVFAVALSRMYIRIWCPTIQVPLPEVHNKKRPRSMGSLYSSLSLNKMIV